MLSSELLFPFFPDQVQMDIAVAGVAYRVAGQTGGYQLFAGTGDHFRISADGYRHIDNQYAAARMIANNHFSHLVTRLKNAIPLISAQTRSEITAALLSANLPGYLQNIGQLVLGGSVEFNEKGWRNMQTQIFFTIYERNAFRS